MKTAYPTVQNPVKITLYRNVPFDNSYKNHSIISEKFTYNNTKVFEYITGNVPPCEMFLDRCDYTQASQPYIYPRSVFTGDYNFNFSNGLIASVVMELTPAQTNSNYMKVVSGNDIYYYFVTGIKQENFDTYSLSLELDVLMTYQDEFLEGMKDMPVFTKRKHCHRYTSDGLMPYCADFKTGEDTFAGVKPTLIKDVIKLNYLNDEMKNIADVMWLYICVDTKSLDSYLEDFLYICHDKCYPLIMLALPINVNSVTYKHKNGSYSVTFSRNDIITAINSLIGDGSVHGAKISPYPPFSTTSSYPTFTLDGSRNLTIAGSATVYREEGTVKLYEMSISGNSLMYLLLGGATPVSTLAKLMGYGCVLISYQNDTIYDYEELSPSDMGISNVVSPTITDDRYLEPKLLFSPFRKYKITAQYCNEGSEFYPELLFSENVTATNGHYFAFLTNASAYIGDNNYFTRIYNFGDASIDTYNNYKYEKIGLSSAVNYIMPCGTDALDIFNSTQAQSFYTSKVASGITSGLAIAGGIGSVALGVAGAVGSMGMSTPVSAGLIAGGASAIASGIAGIATTIAGANAKVEDLKNTPDSVNVSGSNFITDENITEDTNGLPYIVIYDVSSVIKENANDYFYSYGYQVARECYFNTELAYNSNYNHLVDNNLFGRTIFNYIQIEDDIVNKINADIPYIAKQKLSSIFNNGITIWNFFGFAELWYSEFTVAYGDYDNDYKPDNWFLKCVRDNTEYYGETYTEQE
ncbi:MAG: hypothetical protein J6T10_07800 [Methanobrevibacter sp.]|nr:hypothetical protein [Methanobrevibacter sp.]